MTNFENLDNLSKELLLQVADFHSFPKTDAFSVRNNGESVAINSTENVLITKKKDKAGIDIFVKANTKEKTLHIPVIISKSGVKEEVYNDFYIQNNCSVKIIAGCGIHNDGKNTSQHNGVHSFHIGENCKITYIERHLGFGESEKNLSPTTQVELGKNSELIMETTQLSGVNFAKRDTVVNLQENAKLIIKEKILTQKQEIAKSLINVSLNGKSSSAQIISRVVAKDCSKQEFFSKIIGNEDCFGRVECDGIILDKAEVESTPSLIAKNINASLSHEAQIGKIAGEQLIKLETLGLTQSEAENLIIAGLLK